MRRPIRRLTIALRLLAVLALIECPLGSRAAGDGSPNSFAPQSRRANSVVMDVDFTEQAAEGGADALDIVGTIQLILDRIAARTAPRDSWGDPRSIIWMPVNAQHECQSLNDTAILEVYVARFISYTRQWVVVGHQHSEADLSFRLIDCSGRELMRFPQSDAEYASASFSPYFFSISGTAAAIALATSTNHNNNLTIAAIISAVNSYGSLQPNIGAHDPLDAQELALFRLVGNIPGKDVPPPAPGTVSSLLQTCKFFGQPGGHIALTCPSEGSGARKVQGTPRS
jgi:hypothetical protein